MFKVGDKVKVVKYTNIIDGKTDEEYIGKIGTVLYTDGDFVLTDIPHPTIPEFVTKTLYYTDEVELVKEKFKVGDRVRIIKDDVDNNDYLGREMTIVRIQNSFIYGDLQVNGSLYKNESCWYECELELID